MRCIFMLIIILEPLNVKWVETFFGADKLDKLFSCCYFSARSQSEESCYRERATQVPDAY